MSKKKKRRFNPPRPAAAPSTPSPATPPVAKAPRFLPLKEALAAGRARKAFILAKDLLSQPDLTPEELALVARAVERKAQQMRRDGNADQIEPMAQSMFKRAPALTGMIQPEYRILFHHKVPYAAYESDPVIREQLDAYVLRLLRDPAELAENKDLPDQHPLKQSARLILATWEKIEAGPSDLEELNSAIGRRSPFVAWRLFLNALNAWYGGRKDLALDNLRRVPEDAALRNLANDLQFAINDETSTPNAEKIIAAAKDNPLQQNLQEIEDIIYDNGSLSQARRLMNQTFTPELRQNSPILYRNLLALLMHHTLTHVYDTPEWLHVFPSGEEFERAYAMTEVQRRIFCEEIWQSLLAKHAFTPLEKALIYDFLASGLSLHFQPDADFFGWHYAPRPITKAEARQRYDRMAQYWEKSVTSQPLRDAFQKWHTVAEAILTPAQSDKILERWLKAFPDDEHAARKILKSARKRHVNTKATKLLQQLQERFPQDTELNNDAAFLEMEKALEAINKGDQRKAIAILDDSAPPPGIFFAACHHALRHADDDSQETPYPIIDAYIRNHLADNKLKLPPSKRPPPATMIAADFFAEIDAILAVNDPVWGNAKLSELYLPNTLSELDAVASERLWDFCALFLENEQLYNYGSRVLEFLWYLAGSALKRRDPRWIGAFFLPCVMVMNELLHHRGYNNNYKAYDKLQHRAIDMLAAADKCLLDADNVAPRKFIAVFAEHLDFSNDRLTKRRERCSPAMIEKMINDADAASLQRLLEPCRFASWSYPLSDQNTYPVVLPGFELDEDDENDDDDDDFDFDDDDLDDDLDDLDDIDEEALTKALLDALSKVLNDRDETDKGRRGKRK